MKQHRHTHRQSVHVHSISGFARKYDPTRTTTLRKNFASQMRKRFRSLRGAIREAIDEKDAFGLKRNAPSALSKNEITAQQGYISSPSKYAWNFPRNSDKIEAFMDWLGEQVERGVLEVITAERIGRSIEKAWTNMYIDSAYQQGIRRANQELDRAGYDVPDIETQGGIQAVFNQPVHADRVGLLYTRTYSNLKGITSEMETQLSRILARGMAQGKNPRRIAKELTRTIKGPVGDLALTDELGRFIPAERRAEILARTEVIRAHHAATMQTYENWQARGIKIKAEWQTAGDNRVCPECAALQGQIFSLEEMKGAIPLHPQCRCVALPVDVEKERNK